MEKKTYDFFNRETWDIWHKNLDSIVYIFTYNHPKENKKFLQLTSEGISECEDFRGVILTNISDNEFYVCISNKNILDTDIYTFKSLVEAMDFICETNNPKYIDGAIHIHEFNLDLIKRFGYNGLALPVVPIFNISQESLNIVHCNDFSPYCQNYDILKGIKRYCERFLIERLISYKHVD